MRRFWLFGLLGGLLYGLNCALAPTPEAEVQKKTPYVIALADPEQLWDTTSLSVDVVTDTLLPQVVWHSYFIGEPIEPVEDYLFSLACFHSYLEVYGERYYIGSWGEPRVGQLAPPYNIRAWLAYPPLEKGGPFIVGFAFEQATGHDEVHYLTEVDTSRSPILMDYDSYWREEKSAAVFSLGTAPEQAILIGAQCLRTSTETPK